MKGKVAVICLCYNHEKYVQEAMQSVLEQTYSAELIIVDDASSDDSVQRIKSFIDHHPNRNIKSIFLRENIGNCKAFNKALELVNADYIIDLAADDRLLEDRVGEGLQNLERDRNIAVNFTNANYINEEGEYIKTHYPVDKKNHSTIPVPEGNLFYQILQRYFICSPSMMYRSSFLKELGGYDEDLAYEDFDIMLRLSRQHLFSYTDKILVEKRVLSSSMSHQQYQSNNKQLASTLKICYKAFDMIQDKRDKKALLRRIFYESRQAFLHKRFILFSAFINLGFKTILQK
ncbi:glycosyltransferase [uncultured Marivirga sp.]|uniref:glycosyltransferase n=1 Tax=uncultured Marivirga sp. TaxID=1123707 RepID=UPI0030ED8DE7|tara:strand:- start:46277 stop:47143 length:867 start_codon:yes stop_codon:yes gene_type:complete